MKDAGFIIVFIISVILASIVVKLLRRLFMSIIGADAMFMQTKTQIILIVFVALCIFAGVSKLFGVS